MFPGEYFLCRTNLDLEQTLRICRIFPFGITVGGLTILFIVFLLTLISIRRLLPVIVTVFTFILFVLYLTGLVETAIQLFSSSSNVNSNCQTYVLGAPVYGQTLNTLAWLEQQGICQSWYAVFAFWIIGGVFLVWLFVIAVTVAQARVNYY